MNIKVDIERLILEGISLAPGQKAQLQTAVESELTKLLKSGGVSPDLHAGGAVPRIRANAIQLSGGSNPSHLGKQIAQTVYGSIGGSK